MSNNTIWKILSMLTMTYRERKRVCPLLAHPLKPGIFFYFIISTAIASNPLRKRVMTMQNILISDIFSSIRFIALSISVFMALFPFFFLTFSPYSIYGLCHQKMFQISDTRCQRWKGLSPSASISFGIAEVFSMQFVYFVAQKAKNKRKAIFSCYVSRFQSYQ